MKSGINHNNINPKRYTSLEIQYDADKYARAREVFNYMRRHSQYLTPQQQKDIKYRALNVSIKDAWRVMNGIIEEKSMSRLPGEIRPDGYIFTR